MSKVSDIIVNMILKKGVMVNFETSRRRSMFHRNPENQSLLRLKLNIFKSDLKSRQIIKA